MAVPNPTGSFPAKTNSAQLPCSFPRPAFWSPLGRNRCRFSRIRPRSPCVGFLSGLGCGRSALRGADTARSGRLLARCGRRALGTSASGGATAFRMDGYCRALGFFRKGSARGCVGTSRARYVRHTIRGQDGCFRPHPHPPVDILTDDAGESGIVYLHYCFLSLCTLSSQKNLSAYLSMICQCPLTDAGVVAESTCC